MGAWQYDEAFSRNRGLINAREQEVLRRSRVAIAGMGGVGGIHLITLARLGIGAFRIADPDEFEVGNFNRQYGAEVQSIGRSKAQVMAEKALQVNPELEIDCVDRKITAENVDAFLDGVDLLVDGVDFFSFGARRLLFQRAREKGIWAVTAGPIGFSTAWLTFDPAGMPFDRYFDLNDETTSLDAFCAFAVGVAPRGTHFGYMDLTQVDASKGRGPSVGLACSLAAGVTAAEATKILLKRGPLRPAPCYSQFDGYWGVLRRGRLWWGNRSPLQQLKRRILRGRMLQLGWKEPAQT